MPSPSLFINTSLVKWTPVSGTLLNLNRITQAGLSFGAEVINNRADLDIYDSSAHIVGWKPSVTFAGRNVAMYLSMVYGIGAISWQIGNADNPAGTGSLIWTMSPSHNPLGDYSGPHGQYATGNLTFNGLAADGVTNPLSYTVSSAGSFLGQSPNIVQGTAPRKLGLNFTFPLSSEPIPEGKTVDAVIMRADQFARGPNHFRAAAKRQVEAAKILNCDPDQVFVRWQGLNRLMTPVPTVNLKHPRSDELDGQHRFTWKDRGDGIALGYLTDEALQADADAMEEAA